MQMSIDAHVPATFVSCAADYLQAVASERGLDLTLPKYCEYVY